MKSDTSAAPAQYFVTRGAVRRLWRTQAHFFNHVVSRDHIDGLPRVKMSATGGMLSFLKLLIQVDGGVKTCFQVSARFCWWLRRIDGSCRKKKVCVRWYWGSFTRIHC